MKLLINDKLNIVDYTLALIILIVCAFISVVYGWISFATFTKRLGLNGGLYYYYQVDRLVFGYIKLVISFGALFAMTRLLFFIFKRDKQKLVNTFIQFAIFIVIVIVCEVYMSTRFIGKG